MSKYLIFRTDRIGDFIFSRMLIYSIKMSNPKNIVDLVCSQYNSNYVCEFSDIRKIYILDKFNIRLMLKNCLNINREKYDYCIILDGKRRSIFFSLLLKIKTKVTLVKSFRPIFILKNFFDKYFINSEINSQYFNFKVLASYIKIKIPKKIEYFKSYKPTQKNRIKVFSNYTLLHLDEKWFEGYYHDDFKYMNLNKNNFDKLISSIKNKFKKKIIITSGKIDMLQFNQIKKILFTKYKKKFLKYKKNNNEVYLIEETSFNELKYLTSKSSELICCEGAISHVSHGYNINTYALVETHKTAKFWTNHMPRIKLLNRNNIINICQQIRNI
jgi:ADP-heptose:LPS heptosyltransferase